MPLIVPPSASGYTTGLDKDRPAASAGIVNNFYYATDSGITYQCTNATTWAVVNVGADKCTMGAFSDANYFSRAGANAGPLGVVPYTWVISVYVESLPGSNNHILWCYSNGSNRVWNIGAANGVSNCWGMYLGSSGGQVPLNESGKVATIATGPQTLAVCLKTGGLSVRYSLNGAAVGTHSVGAGYVPPDASSTHFIGRWSSATLPGDWASWCYGRGFAADVADADLQTLSGSPSTYLPVEVSGLTPVWDLQARWYVSGAGLYLPIGTEAALMTAANGQLITKTAR